MCSDPLFKLRFGKLPTVGSYYIWGCVNRFHLKIAKVDVISRIVRKPKMPFPHALVFREYFQEGKKKFFERGT